MSLFKKIKLIFIFCFLINSFIFSANQVIKVVSQDQDKWYSTGVFYELFVRSFKDSNDDKYGDFKGVISKLDYLKSLGITGIWFMPIHPAGERADGYDVTDYMSVNPDYGTMEDFKQLIKECHDRNIKIIIDFVINHVSDQHPFFQDAIKGKDSKYRNWFVWSDEIPKEKWKGSWFPSSKDNPNGYYFSCFNVKSKPDLNYKNREVVEYMKSYMKFWIDFGVDGFRFDAITGLVENGATATEHQAESLAIYNEFRKFLDDNYKDRDIYTVAEASDKYQLYFGNGKDMFNSMFNFKFNSSILRYIKNGTPYTNSGLNLIEDEVLKYNKDLKEGAFWATLLSNHDLYVGTRPFQQLGGDIEKCKLAGALYLTMPGIPFVYYGEEIGMDTFTKSKNDKWLRAVMLWDDSNDKAGFTNNKFSWNMVNENYKTYNVKKLEGEKDSILNCYRSLIKTRVENKSLSLGTFQALNASDSNKVIVAYIREYKNNKTVVIHNFSDKIVNCDLDISGTSLENSTAKLTTIFGDGSFKIAKDKISVKLDKYKSVILKVE